MHGIRGQNNLVIDAKETLELGQVITEEIHVAVDKTSGVVKLMSDTCGELAQTGHLLSVNKLSLKTLKLGLAVRQFDILTLELVFVDSGCALQRTALKAAFD